MLTHLLPVKRCLQVIFGKQIVLYTAEIRQKGIKKHARMRCIRKDTTQRNKSLTGFVKYASHVKYCYAM